MKNLSIAFMTCSAVENDAAGNACWFQTTPKYGIYPGGEQITGRDGKPIKDAKIVFDEKSTDKIMEAFRAAVSAPGCPGILVDQDHFSCDTDKPTTALAWAKEIRRAEDGSLWTRWEFTAKGKELYEGKMLVNRSPVLALDLRDVDASITGRYPNIKVGKALFAPFALESIGMTNKPYFKDLSPLAAAREVNNTQGENMDPKILSELGLQEGATLDDVLAAIKALKDKEAAATATATDATKKAEDAEAKCRGMRCDAFIAAHKAQITDEGKFREAYLKNPEATEAAVALCRTVEPPKAPAARISARDAKTPTASPGADEGMKAKIAARQTAVNAYMSAHPGCSHASAWTACRLADPETFAD